QVGRVFQMYRGVGLERVCESELLADLAHRRHDLLSQQADAGLGVLAADGALVAPDAVDARPGFLKHVAQLGNDGLRCSEEDPAVLDLLLEGGPAARALGPTDRELDKLAAELGREIA